MRIIIGKKEKMKRRERIAFVILLGLFLSISLVGTSAHASLTYNLTLINGTPIPYLKYGGTGNDTLNHSSFSYKDNSVRNPDVFLKLCSNETNKSFAGKYAELVYASSDCGKIIPLLVLPPLIKEFNSSNCSLTNIDIASYKAMYPGALYLMISNTTRFNNYTKSTNATNATNQTFSDVIYCNKTNQILNGSYKVDVSIDDVEKTVSFQIQEIYDDLHRPIPIRKGNIIYELIRNKTKVDSKLVSVNESAEFHNYTFSGGEKLYINGLFSLKVIPFNPCGVINESGYYIMNSSSWNNNQSCVIIENATGVTINFANKTIDGDANRNGSLKNNSCAIIIKDSARVAIKDLRTEQFAYGLCVFNSSQITISGTYNKENIRGIYIENSANVTVSDLEMDNNELEIVTKNSTTTFSRITVPSANFSLESHDIIAKTVTNPPKEPSGMINISQWLQLEKNSNTTWAKIVFFYRKPLPHNVLEATLGIYRYHTLGNGTNGSWYPVPSYTDKINNQIYSINLTNFSIFAPLGEEVNVTSKNPSPVPSTGPPSPGPPSKGNLPQQIIQQRVPERPTPVRLKLKLYNHTIKVQQGATAEVGFNLTNLGIRVGNIIVRANVRKGWKTADVWFKKLNSKETKNGTIYIKVYENEIPGTYLINVNALLEGNITADTDVLKVIVIPRQKIAKLDILEMAPQLTLEENKWHTIGILAQNNGDFNLTNITLKLKYASDCIEKIEGSHNLSMGEKKTLKYRVKVKKGFNTCNALLVLESNEGAIAFSPLILEVAPKPFKRLKAMPIIFLILTLWSGYILFKKFKQFRVVRKNKKEKKNKEKKKV